MLSSTDQVGALQSVTKHSPYVCAMAGRDAWSHAYQPGEIKNITQEQAIDYLVGRSIAKADAQELVKVSFLCSFVHCNYCVHNTILGVLSVIQTCQILPMAPIGCGRACSCRSPMPVHVHEA